MTERSKWAFATEDAAGEFIDAYGGAIVMLGEALHAAREDAAAIHK